MVYEYKNEAGEVREIVASIKNPPPERVVFDSDGNWRNADLAGVSGDVFTRVYGNVHVNDMSHVQYPYVSRRHAGRFTSEDCRHVPVVMGRKVRRAVNLPVIESKEHEKRLCEKYGLVRE